MSNHKIIKNTNIVLTNCVIEQSWVEIQDGVIATIGTEHSNPPTEVLATNAEVIDGNGGYLLAGFIDVHVHGGANEDFMDATQASLDKITRMHMEHGTTTILATTVTGSEAQLDHVIREVAEYNSKPMPYAQLIGVHLEGPFVNPKWKGAQNELYMIEPQHEWLERWQREYPGQIRMQTLAPEVNGGYAYIEALTKHGIVAACGHTDANYAQIEEAVKHGLKHAVHTYNAMKGLHHREPGTLGAVMTIPSIMAEIIADGKHVHPVAIKLLLKAKGVEGVLLVTDAMAAAGMPDGQYKIGELDVVVKDRTARLTMDGSLAGSTLTMIEGYRFLVEQVGLTLSEASQVASLNPARVLGLQDNYGSIAKGKRADLVLTTSTLDVSQVLINGELRL